MVIVRLEVKFRLEKGNEAAEWHRAMHAEGGPWHKKTKGFRIYNSSWSGQGPRIAVEMMFDGLAEWQSARESATPNVTTEEWERYFESHTDDFEWTYWTIEDQG